MERSHQSLIRAVTALAKGNGVSQAELAGALALKRTMVFNLVRQLERAGLVTAEERLIATGGRPSQVWRLNGAVGQFLVVFWSNRRSYYARYDFAGDLLGVEELELVVTIEEGRRQLANYVRQQWPGELPLGVMVALPGVINGEADEVVSSPKWKLRFVRLGDLLHQDLGGDSRVLIQTENDAHLSALGERVSGVCGDLRHYLTLFLNPGRLRPTYRQMALGSGMVWDGKLIKGKFGSMGELDGHFYQWFQTHFPQDAQPWSWQAMSAEQLHAWARDVGANMAHIVHYLSPEAVVVQWIEETVSQEFIRDFRESLQMNLISGVSAGCEVRASQLGIRALLDGGNACLRRAFFRRPEYVDRLLTHLPMEACP